MQSVRSRIWMKTQITRVMSSILTRSFLFCCLCQIKLCIAIPRLFVFFFFCVFWRGCRRGFHLIGLMQISYNRKRIFFLFSEGPSESRVIQWLPPTSSDPGSQVCDRQQQFNHNNSRARCEKHPDTKLGDL